MIGRFSNLGSYKELFNPHDLLRILFGGILAVAGYFWDINNDTYSAIGLILILTSIGINGIPIISEALKGALNRKVNVDELVSLAIIASLFVGEFLSAAIVSFVMMLGALIEEATGESARKAIRTLVEISPQDATVVSYGKEQVKPIAAIKVGDVLLVKPAL